MATPLNELQAQLAKHLAAVEQIKRAIESYGDISPVRIRTVKNIRNTGGLTVNLDEAQDYFVVYADESMTVVADRSDHEGYFSKSNLELYKLQYKDWQDRLQVI